MTHTATIKNEGDEFASISYDGSDHPKAKNFAKVPVDLVMTHQRATLEPAHDEFARYQVRANDLARPGLFECEISYKFDRNVVGGTARLARERFNRRGAVIAIFAPGDMTRYEISIVDTRVVCVQSHGNEQPRGEWWMSSSFGRGYPLSPDAVYTDIDYVADHFVEDGSTHTSAVFATFIHEFRAFGDYGIEDRT